MKKIMIVFGMFMMINSQAITPKSIEDYTNFTNIENLVSLLSKQRTVYAGTVEEINTLINTWIKANIRKKSLESLKEKGFDISRLKKIVIIEWGGGGIPYRALYLSEVIFFVRESENNELLIKKIEPNNVFLIKKGTDLINGIIKNSEYKGNISSGGADSQTYIVTIFENSDMEKTLVIYGASLANIKNKKYNTDNDKDTLAVFDIIMNIIEKCGIKPESGA